MNTPLIPMLILATVVNAGMLVLTFTHPHPKDVPWWSWVAFTALMWTPVLARL